VVVEIDDAHDGDEMVDGGWQMVKRYRIQPCFIRFE
jgi:hypothetical protein